MVISFKKLLCVFLLLVCAVAFFISTFSAFNTLSEMADTQADGIVTVVIDSGHGGEDGGAVAPDGTLEKDINLSIALKLKKLFEKNGIKVVTTRDEDISICDEGLDTLKQRKKSDMKNRLEIFNSSPDNVIISIHQNKFTQSKYSGTQIFYSKNNLLSFDLAQCIKSAVVSELQPDNTRECKSADKNIYLLYNATNPAVIVECGFLSNSNELELLKNDEYQSKLAKAIFDGFMKYYNQQNNKVDN
ncbi:MULTISPECIES: N-acetylmuramoyl-L-alanine amidase [unclassified Ruminococcus]|uniref:N-acetylmuramoyl-L-alanine amidase n=1 Tax=unclassified Ruminococcus TaxID=2608920 RepID=UPI00210B6C2A|nr:MULTISPECIES: N-acetylmuramoyl-L-alanine amidase [unclassified Ruminococcus]MCQ4021675.1 N-acetylmuramoyl-L-alanine amidase [Ruminococcus sp. zg-924]MCQ4114120.1 N-acetylmuramoyl-L-alanine amidase [Ruminococcus sp. zg-921]